MSPEDPAQQLIDDPRWVWREGMRDQRGRRIVDLDLHDGAAPPDLTDFPTGGAILEVLDGLGLFTDVIKQDGEWIVAVDLGGRVQGYAADNFAEAAGWALLAAWDHLATQQDVGEA